jgi:hypothetical protein
VSLFPTAKSDPELFPFRPGLTFAFFNALAWQIGIGTPMVLFAEQLGATPFQVGLAYSFVFLLTPLQIAATALLPRYGFKAVMLGGWGTRSVFLGVPALLAIFVLVMGERAWMVTALVASVFFFCFCRSIGAASGISWFYAILPEHVRGRYFASDQFVTAVAAVGTLLASAALFALLPIYPALLLQYGIALAGSTISYFALRELPDAERPAAISLASVARDTPRHLFRPTPFRRYLWIATVYAIVTTPIPPFAAYYLKVGPRLGAGQIMLFEVLRYGGVMAAAWLIRRWIDRAGAKPFFLLSVALHAVVAVHWWGLLRSGFGGVAGLYVNYFILGLGAAAWTVANLNYLPKVIDPAERTLAVSIHGAVTSCVGGLSPVLWGLFLRPDDAPRGINLGVLELFFVIVAIGAVILLPWLARVPEDPSRHDDPIQLGGAMLRPFRAATYLVNLIDPRSGRGAQPDTSERKR